MAGLLGGGADGGLMNNLRPLMMDEFRSNPDGSRSTEITMHAYTPEGDVIMFPSLWMGQNGPVELQEDQALRQALDYEAQTGRTFPRWENMETALSQMPDRSGRGGVAAGPLATYAPYQAPMPAQKRF